MCGKATVVHLGVLSIRGHSCFYVLCCRSMVKCHWSKCNVQSTHNPCCLNQGLIKYQACTPYANRVLSEAVEVLLQSELESVWCDKRHVSCICGPALCCGVLWYPCQIQACAVRGLHLLSWCYLLSVSGGSCWVGCVVKLEPQAGISCMPFCKGIMRVKLA